MTNKLINAEKSSRTYWLILKSFLNNKKIPLIPPLFCGKRFITVLKENFALFMRKASNLPSNITLYTDN